MTIVWNYGDSWGDGLEKERKPNNLREDWRPEVSPQQRHESRVSELGLI